MSYSKVTFPLTLVRIDGSTFETRYGFRSVTRTDTLRRKRPTVLRLQNGTKVSTEEEVRKDDAFFNSNGSSTSLVQKFGFLGTPTEWTSIVSPPPNEAAVRNALRSSLMGRSVDLATALGEYRETARLFPQTVRTFLDIIRLLRRKDLKALRRWRRMPLKMAAQGASSGWLTYTYGIRPLMGTLHDSAVALLDGSPYKPTYMGQRKTTSTAGGYVNLLQNGAFVGSTSYSAVYRYKAEAERSFDFLNSVLSKTGFTNPLALAWELTTLSFVVDWFINIGEKLKSLDHWLYFKNPVYIRSTQARLYRTLSGKGASGSYLIKVSKRTGPMGLGTVSEFVISDKPLPSANRIASALALLYTFRRVFKIPRLNTASYTE